MRAFSSVFGIAAVLVSVSLGIAQEPPGGSSRFQRAQRPPAAPPQQPGRQISVEVVIADVTGEAEGEMTAERLAELEKAGKVASLSRLRLSALENQPSLVQFGERVSLVTGRTSFGGRGGAQEMLSQENVGTMVSITARVDRDESILMEFQAELTRLTAPPARGDGEQADRSIEIPRTAMITAKSTLRVSPGQTVVAGSKTTKSAEGSTQTWILVSASVPAGEPQEAAALKIVMLKHAKAQSVADMLRTIFAGGNFLVAVDARTNSLVVSASESMLQKLIPLVAELDQAGERADP